MTDCELVRRMQQGDMQAFDTLYERYKDDAYRLACLITGSRTDGEDLAQEAFVACAQSIGSLRDGAKFRPWLLRTLSRAAWKYCRKARRETPVSEFFDENTGESALSAVLRGVGDSRTPLLIIGVATVVNTVLDLWFVAGLGWQVAGAAAATVLSQGAMALFILVYAHRRYPLLRLSLKEPLFRREDFAQGLRFGLPPALQFSVTAGGNIALQNFMNGFGSHTVAAITTAYRVDTIMLLPIINLGSAISTMVAQSKGAGEPQRARHFWRTGAVMNLVVSLLLMAVMLLFGGKLVALFGVEAEAAAIGRRFFQRISLFYVFFGLACSMRGTIEGTGRVVYSSAVSIAALLLRIALSYLLAGAFLNMAIAYAEGLHWIFMVLCFLPFFLRKDRWI